MKVDTDHIIGVMAMAIAITYSSVFGEQRRLRSGSLVPERR